ncbi:sensor histidine kinase [Methylobacterium sp. A54F]
MTEPVGRRFLRGVRAGRRSLGLLAGLVAGLAAAWVAGRFAERSALADLRRTAHLALTLQVGALSAEMQRQGGLPLALAADPEIAAMLAPGAEGTIAERVSGRLAEIARATGAAVIYVVRADGLTVAASNAGEPLGFVGRDYRFRPYFQEAMRTGSGSQFALGTVSGRPGLYLSRRIGSVGVVVVKIEFDGIEAAWRASGERVFATDPRGIVLVASEPDWRFGTLREIDAAERARIRETLEFGTAPLPLLPLHPVPGDGALVRIGNGALPARTALPLDAAVPGTDWRLHALTPVGAAVERERVQGQVIALLASGLAWLGLATLLGRRRRNRARRAEEASRREELEARVRERTEALSAANRQLRAEAEERRRAEAERERLGRELAQAGRLAALGQFAASLAHEINQPLAAIRSYADNTAILVERGRVADAAENVTAIGRLTDRIGALTRQLKGFARRASGRREPVALASILANSLEIVAARAASAGIVPAVAEPPPGLAVLGDGPRLEQVLVNLLQNALDAVAGRQDASIALTIQEAADRVVLTVTDNGPGIPEPERRQVFDAFVTTKPDGLGLGLAISRGIVEDCGGTLAVEEAVGGGAAFRIELFRARTLSEETTESAA